MDLTRQIDSYCERLDASFWAEPVNALTNIAFLISAVVMWRRSAGVPMARALSVVLFAIGLGSFAFHTTAQVWSAIADTTPIVIFILLYIFAINRDVWKMRPWVAVVATAVFIPYAAATVPLWSMVAGLGSSAGYAPVPLLILIYAILLRRHTPQLARGLAIGAGILILSLTARTLDMPLCDRIAIGTHLWWHILNAIMLGWMIEVYRRQMLAAPPARR